MTKIYFREQGTLRILDIAEILDHNTVCDILRQEKYKPDDWRVMLTYV